MAGQICLGDGVAVSAACPARYRHATCGAHSFARARHRSAVAHSEQDFIALLDSYKPRAKPHALKPVVVMREVICCE